MSESGLLLPGPMYPHIELATRKGTPIPNAQPKEQSPETLQSAKGIHTGLQHPERRARSLTGLYNCMGMIVASRRAWVEPEHLIWILREDGFQRLQDQSDAEEGDVVVYRDQEGDVSHVGLVLEVRLITESHQDPHLVLSQWGRDGEYIHPASDVPVLLGSPTEYWTDRKVLQ